MPFRELSRYAAEKGQGTGDRRPQFICQLVCFVWMYLPVSRVVSFVIFIYLSVLASLVRVDSDAPQSVVGILRATLALVERGHPRAKGFTCCLPGGSCCIVVAVVRSTHPWTIGSRSIDNR